LKIFKKPNWFYGRTIKEPKLWGLGFFTKSFGFLRFIVMSENQSFDFLKIVGHGSIIPRLYLLVLFWKKKKIEQCFVLANVFFSVKMTKKLRF
jgi:hypothetical protein